MKAIQKQKLRSLLESTLDLITLVGFTGMLLSTGGQVLFRYVLKISVSWTEELARILFITTMFLGIAIAIREKEHIVVDFLFKKMNARFQALGLILYNTAILILLCFLARGTVAMIRMTWDSYMIAIEWIRTGYLYMVELIAIFLMMLYIVQSIIENIKAIKSGEV